MTSSYTLATNWKLYEKLALRGFFIYAAITFLPLAPSFYQQDFDAGFTVNSYPFRWLDVFSQNNPWFFSSQGGKNYEGWLITLSLSIAAGFLWFLIEKQLSKNKRYCETTGDNRLYNWFFILLRYQIALRMSWFAIAKVFPVQMPFPTLSQLNTNLGDFTSGKLYWLTTGVSPFFEVFAGVFELAATIFILFRRTTTLGALMMVAILLPIWFVNIGYDAGVELASMHLLLLSLLLLAKNARQFWIILIEHKQAALNYIIPLDLNSWQRIARIVLKITFISLFIIYRGFEYEQLYANGKTFKLPLNDGVKSFVGFYNVSEFKINNKSVPYSPYDTVRWQNVVFEKFNTISIRVAKATALNTSNKDRTTEYYGNIGRLYYSYDVDTVNHLFVLRNRRDTSSQLRLKYSRPAKDKFILSGINEGKDSLYMVLEKIDKKYPLAVKRRGASLMN